MEVESTTIGMESDTEMTIDYGMAEDQEQEREVTMKPIEEEEVAGDNNMDEEMREELPSVLEEILPEADMKDVSKENGGVVAVETVMTDSEPISEALPIASSSEITIASSEPLSENSNSIPVTLPSTSSTTTFVLSAESTAFVPIAVAPSDSAVVEEISTEAISHSLGESSKESEGKVEEESEVEHQIAAVVELPTAEKVREVEEEVEEKVEEEKVAQEESEVSEEVSETVVADQEEEELTNDAAPPTSEVGFGAVGCTCAASIVTRPVLDKYLLNSLDTTEALGGASSEDLTAPTVLLTYNHNTYSMFRRYEAGESNSSELDETLPVLFTDKYDNTLYYDTIETLIDVLRDTLSDLRSHGDELSLSFNAIGIVLNEDSIYTREVSLADFDKVHIGCGLSGRLHLTLELVPRFSSGFNALAHHVSNLSRNATHEVKLSNEESTQDEETTKAAIEEEIQNQGEETTNDNGTDESYEFIENENNVDEVEGGEEYDEEPEEGSESVYEDGEWHSEVFESEAINRDENQEGGEGEEEVGEYELEAEVENGLREEIEPEIYDDEALADLDSDDLVAVIEGAEQDLVESELLLEEARNENENSDGKNTEVLVEEVVGATTDASSVNASIDSKPVGNVEAQLEVPTESEIIPSNIDDSGLESDLTPSITVSVGTIEEVGVAESKVIEESQEELENDVVIDYEDAAASTLPSPQVLPIPVSVSAEAIPSLEIAPSTIDYDSKVLSPKRSHSSLKDDEVEDGDLKRPRFTEPVSSA